jgi:hypothetical protein
MQHVHPYFSSSRGKHVKVYVISVYIESLHLTLEYRVIKEKRFMMKAEIKSSFVIQ